jgi:hypothetical protein
MIVINSNTILVLLIVFAIIYALWMMIYLTNEKRSYRKGGKNEDTPKVQNEAKHRSGDIVGKSRFVLPRSHSLPQAAKDTENEKRIENQNIFTSSNDVPEHPRIIPPDELDEVFGAVPEGEKNDPLDIDYPLTYDDQPDEADEPDEDEYEELPVSGGLLAEGVSFEQMGDAYRTVVHNPIITNEKKEETGRVLLHLKETDMFEAIVLGEPERQDRVTTLIDTYLTAFHKRMVERTGQQEAPASIVPLDFDVRNFV